MKATAHIAIACKIEIRFIEFPFRIPKHHHWWMTEISIAELLAIVGFSAEEPLLSAVGITPPARTLKTTDKPELALRLCRFGIGKMIAMTEGWVAPRN
jgi:hypothetical protein